MKYISKDRWSRKHKFVIAVISLYAIVAIVVVSSYIISINKDNRVVYAMVDNNNKDSVYIYAKTIGTSIINNKAAQYTEQTEEQGAVQYAGQTEEQGAVRYAGQTEEQGAVQYAEQNMEQYMEQEAELAINIQQPDLIINGLKTVFRDTIHLNKKDKNILYRIVEAEAGGEDIAGRMLVANVVINRMQSDHHPDTIKGVVFAHSGNKYQFSPISDGRYYKVKVSKETKEAVKRVLAGEDNSSGAEYFLCRSLADSDNVRWFDQSLEYLFTHGCHEFYHR